MIKIAIGAMIVGLITVTCATIHSLITKQETQTFTNNNVTSALVIGADGCTYIAFSEKHMRSSFLLHSNTCTNCKKQAEKE